MVYAAMKTKHEIEVAISEALVRFESDAMGRDLDSFIRKENVTARCKHPVKILFHGRVDGGAGRDDALGPIQIFPFTLDRPILGRRMGDVQYVCRLVTELY